MLNFSDPVNPLYALCVLAATFITSSALVRFFGTPPPSKRFSSLDGFRGLLAVSVLICHSSIWYFYLRSGRWEVPPSWLFTHLGETSVAMFFMITGFLFSSKLIDSRLETVDWRHIYTSRVMRLVPLYFVVVGILLLLVFSLTGGNFRQDPSDFLRDLVQWLLFTIPGTPNLNGIPNTGVILAGVTWSLPYEWLFYFSLPILAITMGHRIKTTPIIFGFIAFGITAYTMWPFLMERASLFFGGILSAYLVRWNPLRNLLSGKVGSVGAILLFTVTVVASPSAYTLHAIIFLTAAFTIIASGNNLFGLLSLSPLRLLGDMAYSIYLIHGIMLFVMFRLILPDSFAVSLSPLQHWLAIMAGSVPLICFCYLTFRAVESPSMRLVKKIDGWRKSTTDEILRAEPSIPAR